jgi:hypothetical protein
VALSVTKDFVLTPGIIVKYAIRRNNTSISKRHTKLNKFQQGLSKLGRKVVGDHGLFLVFRLERLFVGQS